MSFRQELVSYFELAKPRITVLLLVVALTCYSIGAGPTWTWWGFLVVFGSVGCLGTGIFALNHVFEWRQDAKMVRTRERPIPSGRVSPVAAQVFGWCFTLGGVAISFFAANVVTGAIAVFTAVSYLGVYTPLKYRTAFHTALGAFPGAVPPLAGWAVATGTLNCYAWVLFGVMFLWQFPHFLAIEMLYREDYARANVKVVPVVDQSGFHVTWQVVGSLLLLLAVTSVPMFLGIGTWVTAVGTGLLGLGFLWVGVLAVRSQQKPQARALLRASITYLPLVFLLLYFHP